MGGQVRGALCGCEWGGRVEHGGRNEAGQGWLRCWTGVSGEERDAQAAGNDRELRA